MHINIMCIIYIFCDAEAWNLESAWNLCETRNEFAKPIKITAHRKIIQIFIENKHYSSHFLREFELFFLSVVSQKYIYTAYLLSKNYFRDFLLKLYTVYRRN